MLEAVVAMMMLICVSLTFCLSLEDGQYGFPPGNAHFSYNGGKYFSHTGNISDTQEEGHTFLTHSGEGKYFRDLGGGGISHTWNM